MQTTMNRQIHFKCVKKYKMGKCARMETTVLSHNQECSGVFSSLASDITTNITPYLASGWYRFLCGFLIRSQNNFMRPVFVHIYNIQKMKKDWYGMLK